MKSFSFFCLAAASCAFANDLEPRAANWTVGQTVATSSGPVSGHPATNDSEVSEYLGIPFGQAPIGDLRFAAPIAFSGTEPLSGTDFGFSCPVLAGASTLPTAAELAAANITAAGIEALGILSNTDAKYSEDCLYLNVWTKPQVGEVKKAVLVWIYGGGFTSGSSSIPAYNGANIADQEDVIVVSLNYRLNILGFPGNPNGTKNLGLLDQRLAVEWVRDNIENFGGDPTRITLFGQSAGGASVDAYSYAWASDPIAAGFISESGTIFSWGLPNSQATALKGWNAVAGILGCGNSSSDSSAILACMRQQTWIVILEAVPATSRTASILGGFGPTVDDTVIFSNYSERTPAKVPMLLGNNNYEGGLFRIEFALEGKIFPDFFWTEFNLQEFTCPCGLRANASVAAGNPTWRYRYFGVFPNMAVSSDAGTWHEAEVPIIFDTAPGAATADEVSIANYMRGAWAAFAKDPQKGLTNHGWPEYDTKKDTLIRLGYDNITGTNVINPYRYDADCVFVNVSSTNASNFHVLPDLGASVTPTATSSGSSASGTATGGNTSTTKKSAALGIKIDIGGWVGLGAVVVAYML
ncbi:alpha/beta-hydrolase [Hyaloscypha variabilis F]|uniref:Carboxylic ester hydrolase n=1 Tax=Hyaloscypha variabilis (strain UAMH 11265 / GT02V1 / F) TaxID=1149755 RepID=A0A2J6S566_HYAVF|nr:alpha/beta-hydrolase [Hyaloscypha variabilis F]